MGWTITDVLDEFTAEAGPFLALRPVENSVLRTVCGTLRRRGPDTYGQAPPRFGWWRPDGGGEVAAAWLQTPPYPPLLTRGAAEATTSTGGSATYPYAITSRSPSADLRRSATHNGCSGHPAPPTIRLEDPVTGAGRLPSRLVKLRPAPFGADPTGARLERILTSPNYADGVFVNPVGARNIPTGGLIKSLPENLRKEARLSRKPARPVPVHPTTLADLSTPPASGLRLTWMGHSSVLAEIGGRRVLFDPVWGERCSPFAFVGPRRVHPTPVPVESLTGLDVVVISHDHYDHLDMPTIVALIRTGVVFAVPLGVGAHLEYWGVPPERLRELDWNESTEVAGLTLTATPARHFCGRGLRGRQQTLWASWVVTDGTHRIYHSGDTGYFPGFAEIGDRHGPFDATMIQIGAYSEFWPDIHMTPAEGMRAHIDLSGGAPHGVMMPIHWGTFNLAQHAWADPPEGTVAAAREAGAAVATPRVGAPFEPTDPQPDDWWWREVAVRPAGGWPTQPERPENSTYSGAISQATDTSDQEDVVTEV